MGDLGMICTTCNKETGTKEIRQCPECLDVHCAKCYEAHEMEHRHEEKPSVLKLFFAGWGKSMTSAIPIILIIMLLTTGAELNVGNATRSINIPQIFDSPTEIKFAFFMAGFFLLPPQVQLLPFKYLKNRFRRPSWTQ